MLRIHYYHVIICVCYHDKTLAFLGLYHNVSGYNVLLHAKRMDIVYNGFTYTMDLQLCYVMISEMSHYDQGLIDNDRYPGGFILKAVLYQNG